ncbi:MAG TPA: YbhB/YbcL family Raf kinase inhibitor-like protein [Enteractinococcus helveticum]|uniref:YbhB/YbcL family Raf kinase inhibitor-like protein n=1 Tax=Enteractinococcus helveticum TaxID=1837282 RepID=A0A921K889_9MICC|nr:YbhB/YbcL family Raf kinase inhibitor-like protein [Enteractinococcus helveticum]HJF15323.1 YbhB/YbcL family Raf kinase inhibitor-like protein [Enteractinococcus helveticum]
MSFDPYQRLPKLHDMTLTSQDFTDGGRLPNRSVIEELGGKDELPQLSWSNIPEGTKTFALTCLDPDAPTGSGFWHMSAFNIPASVTSIPGGAVRWDTIDWQAFGVTGQGQGPIFVGNSRNVAGFTGSRPPVGHGDHRYMFVVHAVDTEIALGPDATPEQVGMNLFHHAIGRGRITGIFGR